MTISKGDSGNIGSALLDATLFYEDGNLAAFVGQADSFLPYHLDHLFSLRLSSNSFGDLCAFATKDYSI